MTDTEDTKAPEALAAISLDDLGLSPLVAEVKRRLDGEHKLYEAFGLKSPDEVTLCDFEEWVIADHAVDALHCLPPADRLNHDTALRYLRDAAKHVAPAMDAVDRNRLLCSLDLIDGLERIEGLLASGQPDEALEQLRRFIRPGWMATEEGDA